jgi:hypothetical protein
MKDKIIFIPYKNGYGYYLKYIDEKGSSKYLGKIRADSLYTARWFYTLEGIDLEIMEDEMDDAIDDYFEQKFKDI